MNPFKMFVNRILRVKIFNSCPLLFYLSPGPPFCLRSFHTPRPFGVSIFLTNQPNRKGTRFSQGGQNFVDSALLTPSTERSDIGLDYGRAGREPLGVASSSAVLPGAGIYPHFGDFLVMSRD